MAPQTTSHRRVFGLDVLRTVAVGLVILHHFPNVPLDSVTRYVFYYGWAGVDLFFVLSGFLIGGQFFSAVARGTPPRLLDFMARRALRTLPNYLAVLLVVYTFWPETPFGRAEPLWRYLLFIQNFFGITVFQASWSLCLEEHFYLLFPAVGLLMLRYVHPKNRWATGRAIILWILASQITIRAALWLAVRPDLTTAATFDLTYKTFFDWIEFPTITHLDGILVGVSLAALKTFRQETWAKLGERWLVIGAMGVLLFLGAYIVNGNQRSFLGSTIGYTLVALSFGAMTLAASYWKAAPSRWLGALLLTTAQLSYALYLVTDASFNWALKTQLLPFHIALPLALLGGSTLLYLLVEKPFLILRDRLYPVSANYPTAQAETSKASQPLKELA